MSKGPHPPGRKANGYAGGGPPGIESKTDEAAQLVHGLPKFSSGRQPSWLSGMSEPGILKKPAEGQARLFPQLHTLALGGPGGPWVDSWVVMGSQN